MFDISPTEWTAIQLSLRVATVATLVATLLGIAVAWLLARRDFRGKAVLDALITCRWAASGCHRRSIAADIRASRPGWRVARRPSRHCICVSLDRRRAGLRRDVVSTPGAAYPAVDRGGRSAAGTGGGNAGRDAFAGFLTITLPLALPGAGRLACFAKRSGSARPSHLFKIFPARPRPFRRRSICEPTPDGDTAGAAGWW